METVVIDTIAKDSLIRIPSAFNNRRIKVIIIDSEGKGKSGKNVKTRKLNFEIDETLEDVVPFSDIDDSRQFVQNLRKSHWQ